MLLPAMAFVSQIMDHNLYHRISQISQLPLDIRLLEEDVSRSLPTELPLVAETTPPESTNSTPHPNTSVNMNPPDTNTATI